MQTINEMRVCVCGEGGGWGLQASRKKFILPGATYMPNQIFISHFDVARIKKFYQLSKKSLTNLSKR